MFSQSPGVRPSPHGVALLLIAQLYRVEKQGRLLSAEDRLQLRQLQARPILDILHAYLLEIQPEVLRKPGRPRRPLRSQKLAGADSLLGRRKPGYR
jgi:hypothetical protein